MPIPDRKKPQGSGKRDRDSVAAIKQGRSVPVADKNNRADHSGERTERAGEFCWLLPSKSEQARSNTEEVYSSYRRHSSGWDCAE